MHAGPPEATSDLLDSLVEVSFEVIATLTQVASAHDLSLTQLRLLAILRDREPTMGQLAEHLGLDRSSVSGLIDRAADRGLVRRTASTEDRRSTVVGLTPQGRRLSRRGAGEVGAAIEKMITRLSTADQRRLTTLLAKLIG